MHSILTLTTDFGVSDGYVGAVKGVVLDLMPEAVLVDISHQIPPQDIATGAFVLHSACRFFPKGSVHVAVVDPGVGSTRRGLVVATDRCFYVGPDNGLFSAVYAHESVRGIYALENVDLMREDISTTFHGRDVFAPAGGHLLRGIPPHAFGPEVVDPVTLDLWHVEMGDGRVVGRVVHIDHFGNAVSMVSREQVDMVTAGKACRVQVGDRRFDVICRTYTDVPENEALVLFGSLGTLEISFNGGNAAQALGIRRGDAICVTPR